MTSFSGPEENHLIYLIAGGAGAAFIIIVLVIAVFFCYCRQNQAGKKRHAEENVSEFVSLCMTDVYFSSFASLKSTSRQ